MIIKNQNHKPIPYNNNPSTNFDSTPINSQIMDHSSSKLITLKKVYSNGPTKSKVKLDPLKKDNFQHHNNENDYDQSSHRAFQFREKKEHPQIANLSIIEETSEHNSSLQATKAFKRSSLSPDYPMIYKGYPNEVFLFKKQNDLIDTPTFNSKPARKSHTKLSSKSLEPIKAISSKPLTPFTNKKFNENIIQIQNTITSSSTNNIKISNKLCVEFIEGYHDKIILKCLDLVHGESDVLILENNFPGLYQEYINNNNSHRHKGKALVTNMTANSIMTEKLNNMNGLGNKNNIFNSGFGLNNGANSSFGSSGGGANSSFGPNGIFGDGLSISRGFNIKNSIKLQPIGYSSDSDNMSTYSPLSQYSSNGIQSTKSDFIDTRSESIMFSKMSNGLPKITLDQFKKTLILYDQISTNCKFLLIYSQNKYTQSDLGFCELAFHETNFKLCSINKLYLAKIYRKLKLGPKIYGKLIEYIFNNNYHIEKIHIYLLNGNESQLNDLMLTGFKFEKMIMKNNSKYKSLLIRRKDFIGFDIDDISTISQVMGFELQKMRI